MFYLARASRTKILPRLVCLSPAYPNPKTLFHQSCTTFGKKQKKDKKTGNKVSLDSDELIDIPTINFQDVETKFDNILTKFTKASNEIKMGKISPSIFDNLIINIGNEKHHQEEQFVNLASTSIKGRNYIITLFDSNYGKHIINKIIEQFNMSGIVDANNKFQIKIPLPPITNESKQNDVKHLKEVYEKFKHNKSNSLNSVRGDVRNKFNSALKHHHISDIEKKQLDELDKLLSNYTDKLTDSFKQAEKQILK